MALASEHSGALRSLLLEMADERSCDSLLRRTVDRLSNLPDVALARIWLVRPGDICETCSMRDECPDQSACLHLVASAGRSVFETDAEWSRTDGRFRRFPIGVRKVGHVASTGRPVFVLDIAADQRWIADPQWAEREGIRCFGGQPLIHRGDVLGVLAVFMRRPSDTESFEWLRMIADHAAAAIANARAFEEIERLRGQLALENEYLREEVLEAHDFGDIVGESKALRSALEQIDLVAPTDANVLVLGESGTGKELVARAIHQRSRRADGPMVKVNCASVPHELYESEFFGHAKGAFTGALRDRAGRFELADGGTLFLDEVGEIPLDLQSKLLRVLQERSYERVGEDRTRTTDVRIVAATNRDLAGEVEAGRFREDLFYRLNVFPISVAPLRERREDVPLLAAKFVRDAARRLHRAPLRLTRSAAERLAAYDWPGNVRELQNVIERAAITSRGETLRVDLPTAAGDTSAPAAATARPGPPTVQTDAAMQQRVRDNIVAALERCGWRVSGPDGAAELLGVRATTLASRMKKLGIRRPQ